MQTIQERQGQQVACLEEIGFSLGYLTRDQLEARGASMKNNYGRYLRQVARE